MKILSWNVNGVRACAKKGLSKYLQKVDPDVICFQEVKAFEKDGREALPEFQKYKAGWHCALRPGYSGVATLAKDTKLSHELGMAKKRFDDEGRVIITDLGKFYLMNLYFPNGGASEDRHFFKMDFLEHFIPFVKKWEKKKPLILTGDFNIAHKAIDIHDPVRLDGVSGFKPEERDWMNAFVKEGFVDTYRHLHGDKKDQYSWWSYRQAARMRNKGWRIDYFFVSGSIVDRVTDMKMDQEIPGSDHCPLILEVE